jgi:hypothetical protein
MYKKIIIFQIILGVILFAVGFAIAAFVYLLVNQKI